MKQTLFLFFIVTYKHGLYLLNNVTVPFGAQCNKDSKSLKTLILHNALVLSLIKLIFKASELRGVISEFSFVGQIYIHIFSLKKS